MIKYTLFLAVMLAACGVSEGDFVAGADPDPCVSTIPICQTAANCIIDETTYIEDHFPGSKAVVIQTPTETNISVHIFFKTEQHPGEDTEIVWYEPGCTNLYEYESNGDDLFSKAGSDRVFTQTRLVRGAGDHLIEVFSDATAHYFLRISLAHPN